ncbi:MAG: tRNA lysidine(34) synthetase TilS, partial [Pyrinomonadaceae bacterium]|nr:tRNA lysidine(34) synthetase TilS [Pyrinomonadaceae bacterium]
MHKFVRSLVTEWRRLGLPASDESAVVAVSGGADSVSLLLALAELRKRKKLDLRFVVAHFDHGLRGDESTSDERFVAELAAGLGLEYACGKGKIARSGNLEQNAQAARYDFLLRTAKEHRAFGVLTAHTQNDQAETLLMNLIRGSGVEGLAAMPPVRAFKDSEVVLARPLLRWATREETEAFCAESGIAFREDAMNRDPAFSRVRIRKEVIPLLRTFNPKIVASLARTAGLM